MRRVQPGAHLRKAHPLLPILAFQSLLSALAGIAIWDTGRRLGCRAAGLAGATVLRGLEGFGASSRIHTARLLRLSDDNARPVPVLPPGAPAEIAATAHLDEPASPFSTDA